MNIEQVWPEWHEDCVLGEGSFGKVYRARREEYGRTFWAAIKVLQLPKNEQELLAARARGMDDAAIRRHYRGVVGELVNEITMMDNLKGAKNIVGIEDYRIIERTDRVGWELFIRMELLTGFDGFRSKPDYTQGDVVRMGLDLCAALEICEQNNIIHRDIKPDNVFLSRFGEYKLGDFGIAQKLESTDTAVARKGTLNYMAPEVYRGESYTDSVDIYSLGLMLYALLNNGRMPFTPPAPQPLTQSDSETALMRRLSGEAMPLPMGADPQLGRAVARACAFDPAQRYRTAAEFRDALLRAWETVSQYGGDRPVNAVRGAALAGKESDGASIGFAGGSSTVSVPQKDHKDLCKLLSWPLGIAVAVLAVVLAGNSSAGGLMQLPYFSALFVGVAVLVFQYGKAAMGLHLAALGATQVSIGLSGLLPGLQEQFPVGALLLAMLGLLYLCAGLCAVTQKEVRLTGALTGAAAALEGLCFALSAVNQAPEPQRLLVLAMDAAVLLWAYGYDSSDEPALAAKVLAWLAVLPGLGAAALAALSIAA